MTARYDLGAWRRLHEQVDVQHLCETLTVAGLGVPSLAPDRDQAGLALCHLQRTLEPAGAADWLRIGFAGLLLGTTVPREGADHDTLRSRARAVARLGSEAHSHVRNDTIRTLAAEARAIQVPMATLGTWLALSPSRISHITSTQR